MAIACTYFCEMLNTQFIYTGGPPINSSARPALNSLGLLHDTGCLENDDLYQSIRLLSCIYYILFRRQRCRNVIYATRFTTLYDISPPPAHA